MPEPFTLSQPAWALLDLLQEQLGVSVEVLDTSLRPLLPAGLGDSAGAAEHPAVAGETVKSLRSGEIRIDRSTGRPIGIFPLRVARQVAGVLIISRGAGWQDAAGGEVSIERAGHLVRTALESDIGLHKQLVDARYRTRRAHGILRFLAQLGTMEGERELMNAVIQAAMVWFDADCRIYERQPDGSFALAATLPGAEQRTAAARLDRGRAEKLIASRRFSSGGDLEDLGLIGRKEEVLVLPIGTPASEWLMILAGSIDQDVEVTFVAIAGVLAGKVQARERARVDAWQQRLTTLIDENGRAPERVLLRLLEMLAGEMGATEARISLVSGESERVLAALAPAVPADPGTPAATPAPSEPDRHTATIEISHGTHVQITLASSEPRRAASLQLSSWVQALRPWLREAVTGLTTAASLFDVAVEMSSFERRIQEEIERARRFNLGLGLVVIGGAGLPPRSLDPIVSAMRAELRASDLIGRIRGGHVAVLLVHSEPLGAESVIGRLRQRLLLLGGESSVSEVHVGKATFTPEYTSADAFIGHALQHVQNVEFRAADS
jgi:hypothetical protein